MTVLREKTDSDARKIGVQVLDVRLKRVDFPVEISDSVYRRMDAERKRVANELRASGAADGEKIKADADKQREVILAEAYREAQKTKGEGDAKASALYAAAFGRDAEFYAFYRSLERQCAPVPFWDVGEDFVAHPHRRRAVSGDVRGWP